MLANKKMTKNVQELGAVIIKILLFNKDPNFFRQKVFSIIKNMEVIIILLINISMRMKHQLFDK